MTDLVSYKMFIDGKWVDASDGKTFESINPTTETPWCKLPEATEDDINSAVDAAHRAFTKGEWASLTPTARGKYLRRLAELLADQSEHLGRIETIDTGKMLKETKWQAKYIAEFFQFYAGCADKVQGATLPIDKPDMMTLTLREPLGVVAAIVPWNSQLFLVAVKIGPALAAGNTVVLKASEYASAAMLEFGKIVEEAGFPPGVVNIVTGHADPCGRALTAHPLVQRISFTGGTNAARHVARNAAENFAQVSLELGGKSPFIVFDDANIDSAVNGSIAGIFGASGQSCVAGSRLYLHEDIADEFLKKMVAQAKQIRIGDPLDDALAYYGRLWYFCLLPFGAWWIAIAGIDARLGRPKHYLRPEQPAWTIALKIGWQNRIDTSWRDAQISKCQRLFANDIVIFQQTHLIKRDWRIGQ